MGKSFLIIGAGAIGTYIGASLANQGHEISFLEREKDIPSLRKQGLSLVIGETEINATPAALISELKGIQELDLDLVIVALKSYHLESFLSDLAEIKAYLPPLLCLQNGVDSEELLANVVGWEGVIPGTVTSAVDRLGKGRAVVSKQRGMGIAGPHPLVNELVPIFNQAGLNCRYYPRGEALKWSKMLTNLLGNASSAILDLSAAEIYADSGLYRMELNQVREALRVMRRQGIRPVNLPGVPVKALAGVVRFLPAFLSKPLLSGIVGGGRGEKMPSFHIDLYSGKGKSEVDQLNGAVVRAGKETGCPTPVNTFLTRTLTALVKKEIPLTRYRKNPDLFLQDLEASIKEHHLNG